MDSFMVAASPAFDHPGRFDNVLADAVLRLKPHARITYGATSARAPVTGAMFGERRLDEYFFGPSEAALAAVSTIKSLRLAFPFAPAPVSLVSLLEEVNAGQTELHAASPYALAALLDGGAVISGSVLPGHETAVRDVLRGINLGAYLGWLGAGELLAAAQGSEWSALGAVLTNRGLDLDAVRMMLAAIRRGYPLPTFSNDYPLRTFLRGQLPTPREDPFARGAEPAPEHSIDFDALLGNVGSATDLDDPLGDYTPGRALRQPSPSDPFSIPDVAQGVSTPAPLAAGAAPEQPPPPAVRQRHVHLTIEDADSSVALPVDQGLVTDLAYRLHVGLAEVLDPLLIGSDRPLVRPEGEDVTFQVAAISRSPSILTFTDGVGTLSWREDDSVEAASFRFDTHGSGLAQFDVLIHQNCDLLLLATVEAEVALPGQTWGSGAPVRWRDNQANPRYPRTRPFSRYARLRDVATGPDRRACIAVQRDMADGPDSYMVTVLLRGAEMPIRAVFSRGELDSNWSRLRGILDRLRRDPLALDGGYGKEGRYTGSYAAGDDCFRKGGEAAGRPVSPARVSEWYERYLTDLAIAGADMRSNLFRLAAHQPVLEALRRETEADGSLVQVWLERQALDFAFPWHFLYDGSIDPAIRTEERPDPNQFWGYRMEIEQVADCLDAGCTAPQGGPMEISPKMRVRAGSYPFMQTTNLQFLQDLVAQVGERLDYQVWTTSSDWKTFLPHCDAHLLYFFAHGHTASLDTKAQQDLRRLQGDVVAALAVAAKSETDGESDQTDEVRVALARLADAFAFLDAEGLANVNHIRLATGHLLMDDLRKLRFTGVVRPLVVLNMCESAQVSSSISDGLVSVFLSRGATGVIGTEVSIPPQFGDAFGRLLLQGLAEGRRISRVLFELRREFITKRNLLGFVYTYYGDAAARIAPPLSKADVIA